MSPSPPPPPSLWPTAFPTANPTTNPTAGPTATPTIAGPTVSPSPPPPTAAGQVTAPAAGPRLRMLFVTDDYDRLTAAGFAHIKSVVVGDVLAHGTNQIAPADIKEVVISKGSIIVTVIFWDNITDTTVSSLAGSISAAPVSLVLNSTHTTGGASTILMSAVSAQTAPDASAQDNDEGLGEGAIAGIVVGVLFAIALAAAAACLVLHHRARNSTRRPPRGPDTTARRMSITSNKVAPEIIANDVAGIAEGIRRGSIQAEEPTQRRGSCDTWSASMPDPGDEPDADTPNDAAIRTSSFEPNEVVADDDGSFRFKSVRRINPMLDEADGAAVDEAELERVVET